MRPGRADGDSARSAIARRLAVPVLARSVPSVLACGVLSCALLLAGCELGSSESPSPRVPAVSTAPADSSGDQSGAGGAGPTAASIRADGVPLVSGALTLWAEAESPGVVSRPDGSITFTVPLADPSSMLAAPEGVSFEVMTDGSVALHDGAGMFVGGLAAPTATDAGGAALTVRYEPDGSDVLRVVGSTYPAVDSTSSTTAGSQRTGTATGWFATTAIDSATWGNAEGGRSLAVVPSAWTRAGGAAEQEGAWQGLVALAPDADVPGMKDQLLCHAFGAPNKAKWNLEPWRPAVGYYPTLAAGCNPT